MKTLLFLVFVCGVALAKPAPSFHAKRLEGGRTSLSEVLKPGRATLISFWATWCGPCIEELKQVKRQLREDPSLPLELVSINVDRSNTASQVRPVIKQMGFDFPVLLDQEQQILGRYQSSEELPFSVLVSPDGEILQTFQGYNEKMFQSLRGHLTKLSKGE